MASTVLALALAACADAGTIGGEVADAGLPNKPLPGPGGRSPGNDAGTQPDDAGMPANNPLPLGTDAGSNPPPQGNDAGTQSDAGNVPPPGDASMNTPYDAGPPPADPCARAGGCPPGTWTDVTPSGVDLVNGDCYNFGTQSVQVDPATPSNFYTLFMCHGIWKSTDYGQTWKGPINTGSNGATAGDCAGGIFLARSGAAGPPILYEACIRGGVGFWKSTNGGVDWTQYAIPGGIAGMYQDFYPPVADPNDANHLLLPGHEKNVLAQSTDGGVTWAAVTMASGMMENGGTGEVFFVNTGNPATTRKTWLWIAQQSGGSFGTWRTSNGGSSWTQVDNNEHPHGSSQIYQPDTGGVVYMAGYYSNHGAGALRSTDYGQTWSQVGNSQNEAIVFGTSKKVYSMFGWAIGAGSTNDPSFEYSAQPGSGSWTSAATPGSMTQGPAQAAVSYDGKNNIIVTANWNAGLWRYVEP